MGTRADYYIGRGKDAEWLGSTAYDGYPDGCPHSLLGITDEVAFRAAVKSLGDELNHFTSPEMGWPWPWENSQTTDYAYAYDGGSVWVSCFGREWSPAATYEQLTEDEHEALGKKAAVFPDMTDRQAVTLGPRSGVLILGVK